MLAKFIHLIMRCLHLQKLNEQNETKNATKNKLKQRMHYDLLTFDNVFLFSQTRFSWTYYVR